MQTLIIWISVASNGEKESLRKPKKKDIGFSRYEIATSIQYDKVIIPKVQLKQDLHHSLNHFSLRAIHFGAYLPSVGCWHY